ncbi:GCD14 and/or Methyltransf 18 domain containing protein [Asbolus verrucosus]|uniref:tRNA (adenine(58)-N(1))-methyltransferase catalytic subunit TRMT61A n=1 Tax=Asbolus verrucosus TaxID=1661398 RepID=A0A482W1Z1_ASBVE|nr:GCD14 and/or Methyltransf 18 domain containing protein [Asbolus verrucosus]
MSFDGYKTVIEEGDTVILYLTVSQVYSVQAEAKTLSKKGVEVDNVFQTPYGALKCSDLIGKQYGSKITLSKGWGYVLQPTPELWTITLPHRTQIIYTPDISMIVLQLELAPGSIVIESGTGSGSLSHALIRAIKPHGHLYTFDFHENRVKLVEEEFNCHNLGAFVTVTQRDVCSNGFGSDLDNKADSVFLDLPHPWLAIPHAVNSIKEDGGRICSFSPCIEQVQKSCEALSRLGFQEIQTMEVLQTSYSVQTKRLPVLNLDFVKTEKDGNETKGKERDVVKSVMAVPPSTQPGHTGYLTFATLPPVWARKLQISLNQAQESGNDLN